MDNSSHFHAETKRPEITRRGVILLFVIGSLMLVIPLGTVLAENSACRGNSAECIHSEAYRYLVSSFPYVMIGGGLLIGYNMKRISDSINAEEEDEESDESRSNSLV
ncbi:MAG: hypothetical protein ACHQ1H_13015 [Nitrososphaerales archaeon]